MLQPVTAGKQNDLRLILSGIGWMLAAGAVVIVLAFEPALSWFVVPALLVGAVVALFLRSSSNNPSSNHDEARPEIQISKIPVKGGMGLVFTVGTIVIFCIALPEARWFLALAIPAGIVVGVVLNYLHSQRI